MPRYGRISSVMIMMMRVVMMMLTMMMVMTIINLNSHQGRAPPRGRRSSAAPGRGGREGPRAA